MEPGMILGNIKIPAIYRVDNIEKIARIANLKFA
jgi:hypothetical protein